MKTKFENNLLLFIRLAKNAINSTSLFLGFNTFVVLGGCQILGMTGAQRIPLSNDKVNRSIYTEMAKRGR
jgi:hypothetical protein